MVTAHLNCSDKSMSCLIGVHIWRETRWMHKQDFHCLLLPAKSLLTSGARTRQIYRKTPDQMEQGTARKRTFHAATPQRLHFWRHKADFHYWDLMPHTCKVSDTLLQCSCAFRNRLCDWARGSCPLNAVTLTAFTKAASAWNYAPCFCLDSAYD